MPQASEELRAQWPGGDEEATNFLTSNGWRLTREWEWVKPAPDHVPNDREISAIQYMIDEWDYGGIKP